MDNPLKVQLDRAAQNVERMITQQQRLFTEERTLTTSAQDAITRLAYKPDIDFFMGELQSRVHQRSTGKMEKLLTSILQDVLGTNDRVVMEVDTKRQATNLTISVTNGANLEDAYHSRGGAICNILSLGLRFIALSRGRLRKFLVLDEADCWLKSEYAPRFVNVISSLSREMGIQVVMISHHPHALFENQVSLVHLKAAPKTKILSVDKLSGVDYQWSDDQEGIRGIRLKNFQAYEDLTIPLSPGVTCIIGDNDICKSGFVSACRSLIRNEGRETYIRHGEATALVEMNLGGEGVIGWERDRKGSKKTRYHFLPDNNPDSKPLHQSDESQTPEWIADLGFDVGDMDIQIALQKKPVFLLDKPGTQQAIVLSVGKEAGYLMAMQALYQGDVKDQSGIKKDCEKRLDKIKVSLKAMEPLNTLQNEITDLQTRANEIEHEAALLKKMEIAIIGIEKALPLKEIEPIAEIDILAYSETSELLTAIKRIEALDKLKDCHPIALIEELPFYDTAALANAIAIIEKNERLKGVSPIKEIPTPPEWLDTESLLKTGIKLNKLSKLKNMTPIRLIEEVTLLPVSELAALIRQMEQSEIEIKQLGIQKIDLQKQSEAAELDLAKFIESIGGECPSCGNSIGDHHAH